MRFLQSLEPWQKVLLSTLMAPLLPFVCLLYIVAPQCQVRQPRTPFHGRVVVLSSPVFLLQLTDARRYLLTVPLDVRYK